MTIPNKPNYSHGSTGEEPNTSIDYQNGDPVDESEFDYFIYTPFKKIKELIDFLEEVDADGDGVVDEADSANLYKDNDIDSNGDGKVDAADHADNATLVKDNDIDSDGDGRVDEADTAANVKGNDIDSDGDGRVDAADDATTVKNNDIDSDGDGKVNAAEQADNSTLVKNNDIDSDGDGKVNAAEQADTADAIKGNDIDSDGDGKVNAADDADTVGGEPPSNFADSNHGNEEHDKDFITVSSVPDLAPSRDLNGNVDYGPQIDSGSTNTTQTVSGSIRTKVLEYTVDTTNISFIDVYAEIDWSNYNEDTSWGQSADINGQGIDATDKATGSGTLSGSAQFDVRTSSNFTLEVYVEFENSSADIDSVNSDANRNYYLRERLS